MKLASWEDGYTLRADPRREDPLFYYMRSGDWSGAIGVAVDPPYEEHLVSEVTVDVFRTHEDRVEAMTDIDKEKFYGRVMQGLLREFPKWRSVKVVFPYTASVTSALCEAGFTLTSEADVRGQEWKKVVEQVAASDR